jgi:hypothetical protein
MGRAGRPAALHTKLKDEPAHESDARIGTWPRDELERMDREFVERLEQAIARGEEHAPSLERLIKAPRAAGPAPSRRPRAAQAVLPQIDIRATANHEYAL